MVFPYYQSLSRFCSEIVIDEPGYFKGYFCAFCPGTGSLAHDFVPDENWNVISCVEVGVGSHGCCSSCLVVLIELQYIGPEIEEPIKEPPTVEPQHNYLIGIILIITLLYLIGSK